MNCITWCMEFDMQIQVLHETANLLQSICYIRGPEAYNYLLTIFLPSQNWPPETALQFTTKLRDLDGKNFRKYFTDFIRALKTDNSQEVHDFDDLYIFCTLQFE